MPAGDTEVAAEAQGGFCTGLRKVSRARAPDSPCRASEGSTNGPADEEYWKETRMPTRYAERVLATRGGMAQAAKVLALKDLSRMKQVILVNESLKLPRGKLAAQVAHASVSTFLRASQTAQLEWISIGMPKVVLRCEAEADLLKFEAQATDMKLPVALISDAGYTVVDPGTVTCLGIGPADGSAIDALTSSLKLVK